MYAIRSYYVLGLLKEHGTETRVALLPETVKAFTDLKVEVIVEQGAGETAFATNADYEAVGAKVVSRADVFNKAEVLVITSYSIHYTKLYECKI